MNLSDYTADRPDNCQLVTFADGTTGEKCCSYQLLSQQVYFYSGVKGRRRLVFSWSSIDHINGILSHQAGRLIHGLLRKAAEGVCSAVHPLTGLKFQLIACLYYVGIQTRLQTVVS